MKIRYFILFLLIASLVYSCDDHINKTIEQPKQIEEKKVEAPKIILEKKETKLETVKRVEETIAKNLKISVNSKIIDYILQRRGLCRC